MAAKEDVELWLRRRTSHFSSSTSDSPPMKRAFANQRHSCSFPSWHAPSHLVPASCSRQSLFPPPPHFLRDVRPSKFPGSAASLEIEPIAMPGPPAME